MNIAAINIQDTITLSNLYTRVHSNHTRTLMEAMEAQQSTDTEEPASNEFAGMQEVNISIQDASGFGEVLYKGTPRPDSHENTLVCDVNGDDDTYFKVTRLGSNSGKDLNVTVYNSTEEGDVVKDTFVSSINFIDEIENELNIIKQELV